MVWCKQGGGSGNCSGTLPSSRRRTDPTPHGEQANIQERDSCIEHYRLNCVELFYVSPSAKTDHPNVAARSVSQGSSPAKTGFLGTGGAIPISECLAALLPFLPSGDPDTRTTPARASDWKSIRISLPALRNLDRLQDRQPIATTPVVAPHRPS